MNVNIRVFLSRMSLLWMSSAHDSALDVIKGTTALAAPLRPVAALVRRIQTMRLINKVCPERPSDTSTAHKNIYMVLREWLIVNSDVDSTIILDSLGAIIRSQGGPYTTGGDISKFGIMKGLRVDSVVFSSLVDTLLIRRLVNLEEFRTLLRKAEVMDKLFAENVLLTPDRSSTIAPVKTLPSNGLYIFSSSIAAYNIMQELERNEK